MESPLFADVILPLAIERLYTYSVPSALTETVAPGKRVVVQFGKKKMYSGLVRTMHHTAPGYAVKEIMSVLDEQPVVTDDQLRFWDWLADYYLCTKGEVMAAALPSGLKIQSETRIRKSTAVDSGFFESAVAKGLDEASLHLLEELVKEKKGITLDEAAKVLHRTNILPVVHRLLENNLAEVEEEMVSRYKPKTEIVIRLSDESKNEEWLEAMFNSLEKRAPKQLELLLYFMRMNMETRDDFLSRARLLEVSGADAAALNALIKKKVFVSETMTIARVAPSDESVTKHLSFSAAQLKAIEEIRKQFTTKDTVLLHGVTSSGKTEIYFRFVEEALEKGKDVLYLLPEIALTTQVIGRLQSHFGEKVGVYHSRFNDNDRVELWKNLASNESRKFHIVLGARSALFLPLKNIGLIVVDEEHDSSYKQQDPAPRYNARDAAIILAQMHGAKVLLGSATPSVESYHNAMSGKFGLVKLTERYGGMNLPEIITVNIAEATKRKQMKSHFSPVLIDAIAKALEDKEQVILFQNRRGFAPYVVCPVCGWTPQCVHCDVSLVYHKQHNRLRCHYCGYNQEPPEKCGACDEQGLRMLGFGTEKIEDELAIFFDKARIGRLDLDTARTRSSYQQILSDFENRNVDILVGTQMVTKGLDFDHVSTVGILNADSMMKFPDFRAFERSFQLMSQVGGRSGRKNKRGKVFIQTFHPDHSIIGFVTHHDYESFYSQEIIERQKFAFPPFVRLVEFTLKHKDIRLVSDAADFFTKELRMHFKESVYGPEIPPVARIKNRYLKTILVKTSRSTGFHITRQMIRQALFALRSQEALRSVWVQADVDPQ